jgi:superfamily II DNA or RNA helicase
MRRSNKSVGLTGAIRGCTSWHDIQNKWQNFTEKEKGDFFEELVKAYLQLDPEYASKLKHVWLGSEVPQVIARKLQLPATDQGIDIIAETHDGDFWAVQCKYRQDTDHSLTWRDLSTFTGLAFGVCRGFSFGIICSTTERITHVLKDQERISFCALDVWQALDADFIKRLEAHLAHKPTLLKPLKPKPHQKDAVKDGHEHFVIRKSTRGKLIMPCGSGKSLTAYWIAGKLAARSIVIAVPSLALIRQTLKVWLRETQATKQDVEWICVCSDESAGRIERDDNAVLRQDLGVPCLTDSKEIATWLKRKHRGLTIVFTTYQSGETLAKAARNAKFSFDLGVMDEAHKTVGDGDKLFSHLLHDKNLTIRRRLFMTATERRYAGQSDTVLSMDDPAIYGETFHLLSFKRAMEYDPPILSDYKIISIAVSREEVAELIRKNAFVRPDKGPWNEEIEADMLASLIALRKAMKKYPIQHAVSFHGSIQRAELFKTHNDAFSKSFRSYGKLETFHVSGKTPTGTRARVISEFARAERALITNARCLTEGVDVPGIDCVLFADPRRSAVDIVQAVGRALRPADGKQFGYVIVPILHEADATPDDIFKSTAFKEILTTLRALAANDDRIIEYFRVVSQGQQRMGGGSVQFDIDERLAKQIDLEDFAREIELKCWDRLAKLSWRPFEDAREFARSIKIKKQKDWVRFCKGKLPELGLLPADIPATPYQVYADNGWISMGDWLGTGNVATFLRSHRNFHEARSFVHGLNLRGESEWRSFIKGTLVDKGMLPTDIPATPAQAYANSGWKGYGDWLGTGTIATNARKYRSFKEARDFARGLKLKSQAEWNKFCKGKLPKKGKLPPDIPAAPQGAYAGRGWKGIGDWLGTGTIATHLRVYLPFEDARAFARELRLKNGAEWRAFCKGSLPGKEPLPLDIPAAPNLKYADQGWIGMGDWLGTGIVASRFRAFRPFKEARTFVRSLRLKDEAEWIKYYKGHLSSKGLRPPDIPSAPRQIYKDQGWIGMSDWLGTGKLAHSQRQYRAFEEARAFVHGLGLKSGTEWREFCKGRLPEKGMQPHDIPSKPERLYLDKGWKGMGDWLGTGAIAPRLKRYRAFEKARSFARGLGLTGNFQWREFCKGNIPGKGLLPADIPANPDHTYAENGWQGYGDWLGTGTIATHLRVYLPFKEARAFVHGLGLKSGTEWKEFCKGRLPEKGRLPHNIPAKPDQVYRDKGWEGMGDWLGTGAIAPKLRQYRAFKEARAFVHSLGLMSQKEWNDFCKGKLSGKGMLPPDIPAKPYRMYADKGWIGLRDWLGTERLPTISQRFCAFEEARVFVHSLKLKSFAEWIVFCRGDFPEKGRLPPDIPTNPQRTYSDKGWAGFGDWLGTDRTRVSKSPKRKS